MRGFYYLHTNGHLIYKPESVVRNDEEYFESPFVVKVWTWDREDKEKCKAKILQMKLAGANIDDIKKLEQETEWEV